MKIFLHPDSANDQLYISFGEPDTPVARSLELATDIFGDFDEEGHLVGIDITNVTAAVGTTVAEVSIETLLGVKEAATLLGLQKSNFVRDYANSPAFPNPVAELGSGRIWLKSQVDDYIQRRGSGSLGMLGGSRRITDILAAIKTHDHLAFHHVALSYFACFLDAEPKPPTIDGLLRSNLGEDQRLLALIREADIDGFVTAAERLFVKYRRSSKSVFSMLVPLEFKNKFEELFREVWANILRSGQVMHDPLGSAGTFTRWVEGHMREVLNKYGIPISHVAAEVSDEYDPMELMVVLDQFELETRQYEKRRELWEAEKQTIEYLERLSTEDIRLFYGQIEDDGQIQRGLARMASYRSSRLAKGD